MAHKVMQEAGLEEKNVCQRHLPLLSEFEHPDYLFSANAYSTVVLGCPLGFVPSNGPSPSCP